MSKVKSIDELKKMRDRYHSDLKIRENSEISDSLPQIKVAMGDCGIAAGAREIMSRFNAVLSKKDVDAVVVQGECIGCCDVEPVVEVMFPDEEPVIYCRVTTGRVEEIVDKHIGNRKIIEDLVMPMKKC